jgi:hypothetical protein
MTMTKHASQLLKTSFLSGFAVLALTSCAMKMSPNAVPVASQTYAHLVPLTLNVSQLDINVEPVIGNDSLVSLFPTNPQDALNSYLHAHFKSTAYGDGALNINISDMHFTRLRVSGGKPGLLDSLMEFNDSYEYKLTASIDLKTQNQYGVGHAATGFDIGKSLIMPSHFSLAKKEQHLQVFLDQFITDLDQLLTDRIENWLSLTPSKHHATDQPIGLPQKLY